ncbi:MAG: LuxR C-terminal-related transcriptional regulator [Armatimonadota bacterium]|nr:LuxR C-terminal-related transcriptional regulator [bacterium]
MLICDRGASAPVREPDMSVGSGIDMHALSQTELIAMNRVLVAMFDSTDAEVLVSKLFAALREPCAAQECALYIVTVDGAALRTVARVGDGCRCLPDIVPHTSSLYETIESQPRSSAETFPIRQLSLFGECVRCVFRPIISQSTLTACVGVAHISEDSTFLDIVLSGVTLGLELLRGTNNLDWSWYQINSRRQTCLSDREIRDSGDPIAKLTAREVEVLQAMSEGLTNREIAERLFFSISTCKRHVESILSKLDVRSRSGAVAIWMGQR